MSIPPLDGIPPTAVTDLLALFRTHKGKDLGFSYRQIGHKGKESFAHAEATGGGHAILERFHIVGVVRLSLFISGVFQGLLLTEAGGLVFGIIEFAKALPYFRACDDYLETFNDIGVL